LNVHQNNIVTTFLDSLDSFQSITNNKHILPALEGRSTPITTDNSRSFDILLAEDNDVNQQLSADMV
jgi:osomolarity two-component system sensor histidine kinase NIK1